MDTGRLARIAPGLLLSALVGFLGMQLAMLPALQSHGMSALTAAIILGMIAGNTLYARVAPRAGEGVAVARQTILRLGVVLYGFRLTLQDIRHVGLAGVLIDVVMVVSTVVIAYQVGTRWLKLDSATALLVGAGSAICGAAAVLATEPVVRGKAEQVSVAVAGVVILGTVAIFLYPLLQDLNLAWQFIPGGEAGFGVYIGSTVHEVAQVVAASREVGPAAAGTAVIAKMVRVLMLAPFLVALAAWLRTPRPDAEHPHAKRPAAVPPFAFLFIGVVLFNSLGLVSPGVVGRINDADTFLLAMAMGALGLSTHLATLRRCGRRPMVLALVLFAWLVVGGATVNRLIVSFAHGA
ncbi:MAG: YeiH family putative sulfate export transporter [Proteobacteria bacterium]|nr:YeiH family putative sulfate export transporter [Pseudomonadota bacterium]